MEFNFRQLMKKNVPRKAKNLRFLYRHLHADKGVRTDKKTILTSYRCAHQPILRQRFPQKTSHQSFQTSM